MTLEEVLALSTEEILALQPMENYYCDNCRECSGCYSCSQCRQCVDCLFCSNCWDCYCCYHCTNLVSAKYAVGNKQYTPELYYKVIKLITKPWNAWENWHDSMLE
jgi:hypothetical protein